MSRTCEYCGTMLTNGEKSCSICGKTNETKTSDNGVGNFCFKTVSFLKLSVSAFFEPIPFYKKSSDMSLLPHCIISAVFYLLFFGGIVTEKLMLGYFSVLKASLIFLGMIPLSAFLFLAAVSTAFYSAKYSSGEADVLKIVKTLSAGYFIPSFFSFFGLLFGVIFEFSAYSLLFTGQILTLVPFYLLTAELNRKKRIMTFLPTVALGVINTVFSSLVFGLKF